LKKSKYFKGDYTPDQTDKLWSLAYITFDLKEQKWAETIAYLSRPDEGEWAEHTIVIEQRLGEEYPPHVIIKTPAKILSRHFNEEGTGWTDSPWKTILSGNEVPLIHALFRTDNWFHLYGISKKEFNPGYLCVYSFDKNEVYKKYADIAIADFIGAAIYSPDRIFYFYDRGGKVYYRSITISGLIELSAEIVGPVGLSKIAPHNGMGKEGFRLVYKYTKGQQGFFQALFTPNSSNQLVQYYPAQVLPFNVTWLDLVPRQPFSTGTERRQGIADAFSRNSAAPAYIMNYLWESYFFFPLQVSKQLERSRQYAKALDYFRLVYKYSLPVGERKIFYGLQQEENLSESYERPVAWLSDPLNPHHIAATRKQAYSRYTLLALTRLCLQAADAEFVRDTAESLASARAWYTQALELLQSPEFQQGQVNWGLLFTVPQNPVVDILAFYAEVSLYKLHTGRNIAGDEREAPLLEHEIADNTALQGFGDYRQVIVPASSVQRPTAYRFAVLLERAKQLAGMAQQMEAAFLSALEKLDAERLQLLNVKNELQMAKATIRLQDLRVKEARDGVNLAEFQKTKSTILENHYSHLLNSGLLYIEQEGLDKMTETGVFSTIANFAGAIAGIIAAPVTGGASLA
ncbi:MAG: hypothetical protein L6Q97_26560, partial [Thermoanaerobaculia bacterium]|nr:hypothetical protein [Thermoanaerobaculia bacterium]